MEKRWSKTEIAHLKRNAGTQTLEELAQRFHTDSEAVRRKIEELQLVTSEYASSNDAAIERYAEALKLIYSQEWQPAAECLESLIADADQPELLDRARQFLLICQRQLAEPEEIKDPYLYAVFEKNRGNLEAALELCEKQDGERYIYLMASIKALAGDEEEALSLLADAIRSEPKNRVYAYHDPDFRHLHGQEEFTRLVASNT